jgi:hypothetical protein
LICAFGTFNQANSIDILKSMTLILRDRVTDLSFDIDSSLRVLQVKEADIKRHFTVRNKVNMITEEGNTQVIIED